MRVAVNPAEYPAPNPAQNPGVAHAIRPISYSIAGAVVVNQMFLEVEKGLIGIHALRCWSDELRGEGFVTLADAIDERIAEQGA